MFTFFTDRNEKSISVKAQLGVKFKLEFSLSLQFCCFLGGVLEWDFVRWSSEKKMEDKVVLGLKKFEKN